MALLTVPRAGRPACFVSALALLLALLGAAPATAQDASLPLAVKATYLLKFIPFIDWPAPNDAGRGVTLCIAGADPFGAVLDRALAARAAGDPPVLLRRLPPAAALGDCTMLYAGGAPDVMGDVLAAVAGRPVLSVTDSAAMAGPHGIINFVEVDNRIRFQIDLAQATRSRLGISSKLLSLAVTVKQRP